MGDSTKPPIVSSYNDRIRPLFDTIEKMRNLNVMGEEIQLPTIVVVGDQSSGKSSVLESLAGISLPGGQGICTRVPLVMRLQRSLGPESEVWLEYSNKIVKTDEEHIAEAICAATNDIAGSGKGVSDTPITLHMKKGDVPDLTMVDLPGITRIPLKGQAEDIYEQITRMIRKYIEPKESIILNVLSATVEFATCESIRMSKQVDQTGERTLAVVTKADKAPEGLLQKVTADDIQATMITRCLPNFLPRSAFLALLSQYVDAIYKKPLEFIADIWDYIEVVLSSVITKHSENFPQIQSSIRRAGRNLICKMKEHSVNRVTEIVEVEKITDYTCNPKYMESWTQKTASTHNFVKSVLHDPRNPEHFSLDGFGDVKISHLRKYHAHLLQQAIDMKIKISSYWTIALRRIVDNLALHMQFTVKNLVNKEFQKEMVAELVGTRSSSGVGVKRLLEESPSIARKRAKLNNSIKLLKESKETVAAIFDQS